MKAPLFVAAILAVPLCLVNAPRGFANDEFVLARPINCELGKSCYVQNYVDHDPSDKTLDFQCGHRTYDGHDGTDIRLPDMEIQRMGVEVLAVAAGKVTHMRDGMDDVSVRVAGKGSIAGKECGNGVVIEHEQGWITQYCHLAQGSLRVKPGERVAVGQPIGLVGLSGDTEFPHLHLTVRHNGAVVDPFAYEAPQNSCNGGHPIWTAALLPQMEYQARQILNFGFSDVPVTMDLIETGEIKHHGLSTSAGALVAYVRAIGLQMHDEQTITIRSPDDKTLAEYRAPPLGSDKAQFFASAGRKLREPRWPPGAYRATYVVTAHGVEVLRHTFGVEVIEQQ